MSTSPRLVLPRTSTRKAVHAAARAGGSGRTTKESGRTRRRAASLIAAGVAVLAAACVPHAATASEGTRRHGQGRLAEPGHEHVAVDGAEVGQAGARAGRAGSGATHLSARESFLGGRWDPSTPIGYRVTGGGYSGSLRDIQSAFGIVQHATGLRFVYQGPTNAIAWGADTSHDPRSDITVSWATPRQVRALRGAVVGLGGSSWVTHPDGTNEDTTGMIALDRTARLRHGYTHSGAPTWGQVMVHEIGHVVGLGHVTNVRSIMYPLVNPANHTLSPADRAAFRAVGRRAGNIEDAYRRA